MKNKAYKLYAAWINEKVQCEKASLVLLITVEKATNFAAHYALVVSVICFTNLLRAFEYYPIIK